VNKGWIRREFPPFTRTGKVGYEPRVKWFRRIALSLLALATVGALAFFLYRSREQHRRQEHLQVAAILAGDAQALEALRSGRDRTVTMLEEFIQAHHRVEKARIQTDLANLGSPDAQTRLLARARLTLLPERAGNVLKAECDRLGQGQHKETVRHFLSERPRLQKHVIGFLAGLYAENFHRLFVVRREILEADSHHLPTQLFFAYAPFEQVWAMLQNSPAELQLRFLLLRLYTGRDSGAMDCLERFPASEIVRVARQTWWPIALEPSSEPLAGGPTLLAGALQGNVATHVLSLNAKAGAAPGVGPEWTSLDRWFRWTYVFRYEAPFGGREGVAYGEAEVHRARSELPEPALSQERSEERLWLPENTLTNVLGPGHCELVRHVPAGLRLPVVALVRQQSAEWQGGKAPAWARPWLTAEIQTQLKFEPSRYPAPRVFSDTEQASSKPPRKRRTGRP
jgi:hypothetical protein